MIKNSKKGFVVLMLFLLSFSQVMEVLAANLTTFDTDTDAGYFSSIGVATDGTARIVHFNNTTTNLYFVQCLNITCTSKTSTVIDSNPLAGYYASLVMGNDGYARIAYQYVASGIRYLKYIRCTSHDCVSRVPATIDTGAAGVNLGLYSTIALGPDGYVRIMHHKDGTGGFMLKLARCTDDDCTTPVLTDVLSGEVIGGGINTHLPMVIRSDGKPRIIYHGANDLRYIECLNADCTSKNTLILDASSADVGVLPTIALGSDGYIRAAYRDNTNANLRFLRCPDSTCASPLFTDVDTVGNVGLYPYMQLASDQFARIAYSDFTNTDVKFVQCGDANCTPANAIYSIVDSTAPPGYTSMVLDSNGFGRISWRNTTGARYAQCVNTACSTDPAITTPSTLRKDTLSRAKISTLSNHTIEFSTSGGVVAGETMSVTFPVGFSIPGALDFTDVDVSYGPTTGLENELTLAASPSGATWGISLVGRVLTITSATGTIPASSRVVIEVGINATFGTTGDQQITNASSAGSYTLNIGGTFAEDGDIAIAITDTDLVTATATVSPSITFDIDAATTDSNSNTPYNIAFGTLSVGTLSTSRTDSTGSINALFFDLDTNAVSGAIVTMQGTNTGLSSTATGTTITLPSNEATISAGQERIGVCLSSLAATGGALTANANYDADGTSNCTSTNGGTPRVGKIQTTTSTLFTSTGAPVSGGRAALLLKASVTSLTSAANDYTNTLTFIAVGTF